MIGVQPTCLNRYGVSAGYVLAGGLEKEEGTAGAKSIARRESSVKYQIPVSLSWGRLMLFQVGDRVTLYASYGVWEAYT